MAIIKNVMVSINKDRAITDSQLYVYRNDHGILYKFTIRDVKYQFSNTDSNLVRDLGGVSAIIDVINPQGKVVAQAKQPIVNDTVEFLLTKEMTDEIQDIGYHQLHIHLISASEGMVTLPPFKLEVKDNPICSFNSNSVEPTPPIDEQELEEIKTQLAELSKKVDKGLADLTSKVEPYEKQISDLENGATNIKTELDNLDAKLTKSVSDVESMVITNTTDLITVKSDVTKAKEDSSNALTKANKASEGVSTITPIVNNLETWKTSAQSDISNATTQADKAIKLAEEGKTSIDKVLASNEELKALVKAQEETVKGNTECIAKLGEMVTKLQTDAIALGQRVTALENK